MKPDWQKWRAENAIATASGMGVISSLCWTLLKAGDEIVADKTLYGYTFAYFQHGLSRFGVGIKWVDMANIREVRAAISEKTRMIYFETPSNPNLGLIDIQVITDLAHGYPGCKVVVDNTFATPVLYQSHFLNPLLRWLSERKYCVEVPRHSYGYGSSLRLVFSFS